MLGSGRFRRLSTAAYEQAPWLNAQIQQCLFDSSQVDADRYRFCAHVSINRGTPDLAMTYVGKLHATKLIKNITQLTLQPFKMRILHTTLSIVFVPVSLT